MHLPNCQLMQPFDFASIGQRVWKDPGADLNSCSEWYRRNGAQGHNSLVDCP